MFRMTVADWATCAKTGAAVSEPQIEADGCSSHTYTMNLGSSTGPHPMKEAFVTPYSYPKSPGICAVPVLPATRYPGTSAFDDSCSSEMASMSLSVCAVFELIGEPAY